MKAIPMAVALAFWSFTAMAVPDKALAGGFFLHHHQHHPIQTVKPGVPPHVDPRFGIISFQPPFARPEPVHPAFQPREIILWPHPSPVWVPGQWVWSGWNWVWVPAHRAR